MKKRLGLMVDHDINYVIGRKYWRYNPSRMRADVKRHRKDKSYRYRSLYYGYGTRNIYKDGIPVTWIIYVSRRVQDSSLDRAFWQGGKKFRDFIRETKIARFKKCRDFLDYVRKSMAEAGYVEHPEYRFNGTSLLYIQLPKRFYQDMHRYRNGFKEMEVLARLDCNRNGLLGTFLVHRKIERDETYYVLRPIEFGNIQRDSEALTLRQLILYGYYPIGMSSYEHLSYLTEYWNDNERRLYMPPETGFRKYTSCTYKVYCARKRVSSRLKKKMKKKSQCLKG